MDAGTARVLVRHDHLRVRTAGAGNAPLHGEAVHGRRVRRHARRADPAAVLRITPAALGGAGDRSVEARSSPRARAGQQSRAPPAWTVRDAIMTEKEKAEAKKSWLQAIRETIYGMAAHDMSRAALRTRASMEHLFILITMGDLLGVPVLPPYYSLRLLPYVVPQIATWKRRMLREKDVADAMF